MRAAGCEKSLRFDAEDFSIVVGEVEGKGKGVLWLGNDYEELSL